MSDDMEREGPSSHEGEQKLSSHANEKVSTAPGRPTPINTIVTRGVNMPSYAAVTASSSAYSPSVKTGSSVQFTPAVSNYSPSIWSEGVGTPMSPEEATQGAKLQAKSPREISFASPEDPDTKQTPQSYHACQDISTAQGNAASTPPYHLMRGKVGKQFTITYYDKDDLPVQDTLPQTGESSDAFRHAKGKSSPLPKKAWVHLAAPSNTASSAFGAEAPKSTSMAKTGDVNKAHTVTSSPHVGEDKPTFPFIEVSPSSGPSAPSVLSDLSAPYTKTHPHLNSQKPPVFAEESHGGNWKIQVNADFVNFAEAFPGAMEVVKSVNPSHHTMKWGTRVVCIKSEYVKNVQLSMERGIWAAMDKVGERINRLWEERGEGDVYLLFSVNGQKSYCGFAIMSGPWKRCDGIEGWIEDEEGTKTMGILPVVWTYIKNVPYDYFKGIQHTHNEQPIVNMWNGMHFPSDKGREVIEIYVTKAHFTNILTWRGDKPYHPYRAVTFTAQVDPRLKTTPNDMTVMKYAIRERQMIEGGHAGSNDSKVFHNQARYQTPRGGNRGAMPGNWRQQPQGIWDTNPTPTNQDRRLITAGGMDATPPCFDGSVSPSPKPGDVLSGTFVVDKDGNLLPVTPTHPPAGRLQIQGNNTVRMPSPQAFPVYGPQQAPFSNTGGHGGYNKFPRGGRGNRGNRGGQLRGTKSFDNTGGGPMQQTGFSHTKPSPMRDGRSFTGIDHAQQPSASPMHPTIHRMRSEVGIGEQSAMPVSWVGTPSMISMTPRAPSTQSSTPVLRDAVSKPNVFVPNSMASRQPMSLSFQLSIPGVGNVAMNGSVPAVENTPSHPPGIHHTPTQEGFASGFKGFGGYPVYPTPNDSGAAGGKQSHSLAKDGNGGKLDTLNRFLIEVQERHEREQQNPGRIDTTMPSIASIPDPTRDITGSELGFDSVSTYESPHGGYSFEQGSDLTTDARMAASVDQVVDTPPMSVANEKENEKEKEKKEDSEVGGGVSLD